MEFKGIDVSGWQDPKSVDWTKVKASGISFVMIKRSEGNKAMTTFDEHYAGSKSVGMNVGAYHYLKALTVAESEKEADTFISLLKGLKFEMPVALDIEDKSQAGLGKKLLTDMCIAFLTKLEAAGYWAMLYCNSNWLNNILDKPRLDRFALWLANWSTNKPTWCNNYGIWQYTDEGKVAGINENVDMNICYEDYPTMIKANSLNGFNKPIANVVNWEAEYKKIYELMKGVIS